MLEAEEARKSQLEAQAIGQSENALKDVEMTHRPIKE